jgi:phytoene dehydrogenase-like protein
MELERHGLKVVLRKTDNFLPGDGDYLLSGRGGLTRKEIARHVKSDGEAYDRYMAELETVVPLIKKWLLKAPPNVGAGAAAAKLLQPRPRRGRAVDRRNRASSTIMRRAARRHPRPPLQGRSGQGAVRLRRRRRQFRLALHAGHRLRAAPPSVRRGGRRARRWGHAIGGMGAITQAMARACREAGVDILLNTPVEEVIVEKGRAVGVVAGGKAWRAAQRRRRRQSQAAVRRCAARAR